MATYTKYENGIQAFLAGQIIAHGTTDVFKVAIVTDAPDAAADDELADTTQIAGSNGYTTGGEDTQNSGSRSGGTETIACVDVVWTASAGNLGASTDKLICYHDYGTTFTVAAGETMTWNTGASLFTAA
jgi:hypothetical protein